MELKRTKLEEEEEGEGAVKKEDAPGFGVGATCSRCKGTGARQRLTRKEKERLRQGESLDEKCGKCGGRGFMLRRQKQAKFVHLPGMVRKPEEEMAACLNWVPPKELEGDLCCSPQNGAFCDVNLAKKLIQNGEELCALVGPFRIMQQKGGHRWSTDDLCAAYFAGYHAFPPPSLYGTSTSATASTSSETEGKYKTPKMILDLGCGIGSVLLMNAWRFKDALCFGIEAQSQSFDMALRNVQINQVSSRVQVFHGDIRNIESILPGRNGVMEKFDLITGTPPYFDIKRDETGRAHSTTGQLCTNLQSAPARFEFRGGIEEYCRAASKCLNGPDARFVVCEGLKHGNLERTYASAEEFGLEIVEEIRVHGRSDKPELFGVFVMRLSTSTSSKEKQQETPSHSVRRMDVRLKGGERTGEYLELLRRMGIPYVEYYFL